ncbi:MAG: hypothetical protein WCO44_06260 [Bacteroidota bacterium]
MKATTLILAAAFTLQAALLFAGNTETSTPATGESVTVSLASLAPVTPATASFEEIASPNEVALLAPVTPFEAAFEDTEADLACFTGLAPVTPVTADFEETADTVTLINPLAPATPALADFE